MIIFLNLLPWIILISGFVYSTYGWFTSKSQPKWGWLIGTFVVVGVLLSATPSYMPKGKVSKLSNPGFEQKELAIQDKLKSPKMTDEQRQEQFDKKFDAVRKANEK